MKHLQFSPKVSAGGYLFAGGPGPANAVISRVVLVRAKWHWRAGNQSGYSALIDYSPSDHWKRVATISRLITTSFGGRNSQGILIGTARTNGKDVSSPSHLDDPERSAPLRRVYEGLCALGVDALISIGGDDTLKTANKLKLFQDRLPADAHRIPVVHLPKTIDNDYTGIDFTFGYFTPVETLGAEVRNLLYDAEANRAYFLAELYGEALVGWPMGPSRVKRVWSTSRTSSEICVTRRPPTIPTGNRESNRS
jgi:6-phosphofructokinase 1